MHLAIGQLSFGLDVGGSFYMAFFHYSPGCRFVYCSPKAAKARLGRFVTRKQHLSGFSISSSNLHLRSKVAKLFSVGFKRCSGLQEKNHPRSCCIFLIALTIQNKMPFVMHCKQALRQGINKRQTGVESLSSVKMLFNFP